ncbi:hypothetical protein [Clostridium estertheticum]|uniref:hypothetical protein n=1 Tax=Clostridium estertheticum TaxID=238834 RepID=UPI00124F6C55|nr:hypothetical protein [Clostridium estertheticum]MBZ9618547.1 hypothetical protein [Clostridium estertheticum subsp. laramiense]WAG76472.1 hypothetical protein LL032_24240 [Clostridium estertheticum]
MMNLAINQAHTRNYTNKYLKDNRNEKINLDIELADKKITEEEDKKDYETYTKSHMLNSAYSFEDAQKNRVSFPPATAPGIVRKAWREQMEKSTEKEKYAMLWFSSDCMSVMNSNKENMPNDLNGYLNLMSIMKDYIERYNHCPGVDQSIYEGLVNVSNTFETELNKYN